MDVKYWASTDVGRKRDHNEDNFLIDKNLRLFIVADGMGGHAAGEVASALAVHSVRDIVYAQRDILSHCRDDNPTGNIEVCALLESAIHTASERIYEKGSREPEKRGMGTTIVVLLFVGSRGFAAYVGDSRIYLSRGGMVYQLTEDHSLMNELIRRGKVPASEFGEGAYAKLKNAMTRAVGVQELVEVDTLDFEVMPGDSFLLCTDGLYEYLEDRDIATHLSLPEVREIPGRLIDLANTRGGKDNITAAVIHVPSDGAGSDRAAEVNLALDTLRRVPVFGRLSYQQVIRVMNVTRTMPMEVGQVIFRKGDPGHDLFVILKGAVSLKVDDRSVGHVGSGSHFGEMAIIDAGGRFATAVCTQSGRLLTMSRDDFYEILRLEAPLGVKLLWGFLDVLAARLRTTTVELGRLGGSSVEAGPPWT